LGLSHKTKRSKREGSKEVSELISSNRDRINYKGRAHHATLLPTEPHIHPSACPLQMRSFPPANANRNISPPGKVQNTRHQRIAW
jgi:hypothetical protein